MKLYVLIVIAMLATCLESAAGDGLTKAARQQRILEFQGVGQEILKSHADGKKETLAEDVLQRINEARNEIASDDRVGAAAFTNMSSSRKSQKLGKLRERVQSLIKKLEKGGDNGEVSDSGKEVIKRLNGIEGEISKLLSKKDEVHADDMAPLLDQVRADRKRFTGRGNGTFNLIVEEHQDK